MKKINFVNKQSPVLNGANLNRLQDNVEEAIEENTNAIDDLINKEVILYDNPDGLNGTITLNDSTENYKYLEIFYGNNTILSTKTLVKNGRMIYLSQSYVENDGWYFVYYEELTINGNTLVGGASNRVDFNANGMTTHGSTQMKVYKVVGIK